MNSILLFSVASFINVMLNTVKTIVMYKKDKFSSASINAITYGFYTIIVVLMAGEMPLLTKIVLTAITNFFGVYASMMILSHFEKDALWKVETTIRKKHSDNVANLLEDAEIPYSVVSAGIDHNIFNIYCATQAQSHAVREILKKFNAKYFVSESKTL